MPDKRIEMISGDHSYVGSVTDTGIVLKPLGPNEPEAKAAHKFSQLFDSMSFSPLLMAQRCAHAIHPMLQRGIFSFCRNYIGLLAEKWETETYDNLLSEEAHDAGIMVQALKDADRWEL